MKRQTKKVSRALVRELRTPEQIDVDRQLAAIRRQIHKEIAEARRLGKRIPFRQIAFTMKDAAALMGVSTRKLRWLIRFGGVLPITVGGRRFVPNCEIQGFSREAAARLAAFDASQRVAGEHEGVRA